MIPFPKLLAEFCREKGYSWIEAMNELQNVGAISDNCVGVSDVAPEDHERALAHLGTLPHRRDNPGYGGGV